MSTAFCFKNNTLFVFGLSDSANEAMVPSDELAISVSGTLTKHVKQREQGTDTEDKVKSHKKQNTGPQNERKESDMYLFLASVSSVHEGMGETCVFSLSKT